LGAGREGSAEGEETKIPRFARDDNLETRDDILEVGITFWKIGITAWKLGMTASKLGTTIQRERKITKERFLSAAYGLRFFCL
jgi:hypothetical protein